jgi:GNAT superfamily N-acetyltransferase
MAKENTQYRMNLQFIKQRAATNTDKPIVNAIFRKVMKPYIDATWTDEAEREACYLRNDACDENTVVLENNGKIIGYYAVKRPLDKMIFYQVHLLPEYQSQGLGTQIIQKVLDEAKIKNMAVDLTALQVNPVCKLYKRLGFKIVRSDEFRHYMEWKANG